MLRRASDVVVSAGASLAPSQLCELQIVMDIPGQLPWEIARRFGNWRVDSAVVVMRNTRNPRLWLRLDGEFQTQHMADGLRGCGMEVHLEESGRLSASDEEWSIKADSKTVQAWQAEFAGAESGGWAGRILKCQSPIWFIAPNGSDILANNEWGDVEAMGEIAFAPARIACELAPTNGAVERLAGRVRQWVGEQRPDLDASVGRGGAMTWGDVLRAPRGVHERLRTQVAVRTVASNVSVDVEGRVVQLACDLGQLPLEEVAGIMALWPSEIVHMLSMN